MKKKESEYEDEFLNATKEVIGNSSLVEKGSNLFYKLTLNKQLNIKDNKLPKRGDSAYQTDICIFENIEGLKFPRVVIELKRNPSTHDIITYSEKAKQHKQVYPWLRYGMIICELDHLPIMKFTRHNNYMDFCIVAQKYFDSNYPEKLKDISKKIIESEIKMSKILERMYFEKKPEVNIFQKQIVLGELANIQNLSI